MEEKNERENELITLIVQRKDGQRAVDAALKAGAPAVTYYYARGTGIRQKLGMVGMFIEAEKQIILMAVPAGTADKVLDGITKTLELNKPGKGFAYIQPLDKTTGFYEEEPGKDSAG